MFATSERIRFAISPIWRSRFESLSNSAIALGTRSGDTGRRARAALASASSPIPNSESSSSAASGSATCVLVAERCVLRLDLIRCCTRQSHRRLVLDVFLDELLERLDDLCVRPRQRIVGIQGRRAWLPHELRRSELGDAKLAFGSALGRTKLALHDLDVLLRLLVRRIRAGDGHLFYGAFLQQLGRLEFGELLADFDALALFDQVDERRAPFELRLDLRVLRRGEFAALAHRDDEIVAGDFVYERGVEVPVATIAAARDDGRAHHSEESTTDRSVE